MPQHIVTCLTKTGPLTFTRVAGVCARRRYALESIIAIPSETPQLSTIILVIEADELHIANAVKQLDKLIDVLHVDLLSPGSPAACEMLLARIGAAVDAVAHRERGNMVGCGMAGPEALPGLAWRRLKPAR